MPISLAGSTNKKNKQMDKERVKVFFMALEEKGVKEIQVTYEGSGDSGSIDTARFYDHNDDEIDLDNFKDEAMDIGYHILNEHYEVDWYNNDGGYGTIHINLPEKNWNIDGYYRELTSVEAPEDGTLKDVIKSFIG